MFTEDIDHSSSSQEDEDILFNWYAVQIASGCEKKVKSSLEQRIKTLDVEDRIKQIEIPQTATVKLRKDGSRATSEEKIFPGYVLIQIKTVRNEIGQLEVDDDAWHHKNIHLQTVPFFKRLHVSGPYILV